MRKELQKFSAYRGLDNDFVHNYCKSFLKFAQRTMPGNELRLIEPFKKMLRERNTISDEVLDYARKKGFKNEGTISNELAAEIALGHSKRLLDEIISTRKLIAKV